MPQKKKEPSSKPNSADTKRSYLKFSGIAFEMLAFILLGIWAGYELDEFLELKVPIFTLILSIVGMIGAILFLINKLPKDI